MIYTSMTIKAMKLAYKAHEGQVDRSGVPYIFHPIHLAEQMDEEISCTVALLHDVVEDTEVTLAELEQAFQIPDIIIIINGFVMCQETYSFRYCRRKRLF